MSIGVLTNYRGLHALFSFDVYCNNKSMDKPISINITAGTVLKVILLLAGAWLIYTLFDLVLVIITAIVIASAIEPAARWFTERKVPRVVAVLIVYLTFIAVIFSLFYFFVPVFLTEVAVLAASLSAYMDAFTRVPGDYVSILGTAQNTGLPIADLVSATRTMVTEFSSNAFSAASSVFGGVLSSILILVFSFYFAMQERGIEEFLSIVTPAKHEQYVVGLWRRSQRKIGLWMQGQLLLGVVVGVLVFLLLTIIGIKHALILAIIAGVFEIIPVFGPILSAIPAVAIAFSDGGLGLGLLVVMFYVIIQQFENHLIYPLVVTKVVGVPPLLVILALIVGAKTFGFLGILLAVPVAAVLQEFIGDIDQRQRRVAPQPAEST